PPGHRPLPAFPTRRSSDLAANVGGQPGHSAAADQHTLSGLGARRDLDVDVVAIQGLELDGGAERGGGHRERHRTVQVVAAPGEEDRKSTRLNSSHVKISYA